MEYVDKQIEIEMTERKAREDLNAFKKQYNYFSNSSSSNRSDVETNQRDREGNRDREGSRGDRDRYQNSNGNRGGRGSGGVEGNGAWGHHDEDHRDNRGEKRESNRRQGTSNSKGSTAERSSRNSSGNAKEKDTGKVSANTKGKIADASTVQSVPYLVKSRGRAGDSEAPLITIPPPAAAAIENSGSVPVSRQVTKNRSSRGKPDDYDVEDQRDDNAHPSTVKGSSKNRRRVGAVILNDAENLTVANLNLNTGDAAFAQAAAAAAARNAPKMEKKNGSSPVQETSVEPLEKLVRKPRNNSSSAKEGKSPDSSPTTFTVVLPSNPQAENKTDGNVIPSIADLL